MCCWEIGADESKNRNEECILRLKEKFIELRDNYVINQVRNLQLPEFATKEIHRYRVTFSGRVQNVGFRLEVCELAKRLGLTGYCKNLENGDVLAELQGSDNKIQYLIAFMESLKRIKIREKIVEELEVEAAEAGFVQR